MSEYILTHTGQYVDLENPDHDSISIRGILSALPVLNRFAGNFKDMIDLGMDYPFYSVAQHSVIGSELIAPELALEFMAHDMPEAYINDISSPLRKVLGSRIEEVDADIYKIIAEKLGLPTTIGKEVKTVDASMAWFERDALMAESKDLKDELLWEYCRNTAKVFTPPVIRPVSPLEARVLFVKRLQELMGEQSLESIICDTDNLRKAMVISSNSKQDNEERSFGSRVAGRILRYTSDETLLTAAMLSNSASCQFCESSQYTLSDINHLFKDEELTSMLDDISIFSQRNMDKHFESLANASAKTQVLKACMLMEQIHQMSGDKSDERFIDFSEKCMNYLQKIPSGIRNDIDSEFGWLLINARDNSVADNRVDNTNQAPS